MKLFVIRLVRCEMGRALRSAQPEAPRILHRKRKAGADDLHVIYSAILLLFLLSAIPG